MIPIPLEYIYCNYISLLQHDSIHNSSHTSSKNHHPTDIHFAGSCMYTQTHAVFNKVIKSINQQKSLPLPPNSTLYESKIEFSEILMRHLTRCAMHAHARNI